MHALRNELNTLAMSLAVLQLYSEPLPAAARRCLASADAACRRGVGLLPDSHATGNTH